MKYSIAFAYCIILLAISSFLIHEVHTTIKTIESPSQKTDTTQKTQPFEEFVLEHMDQSENQELSVVILNHSDSIFHQYYTPITLLVNP